VLIGEKQMRVMFKPNNDTSPKNHRGTSQLQEKRRGNLQRKKMKKAEENHALEPLKKQILMLCPVYCRPGPVRRVAGVQREYCVWLRFIGQSRRKTIARLVDNCPGFDDKKNPKPILSLGKKHDVNPMKANNAIKNLTIDAGKGNRKNRVVIQSLVLYHP